MAEIPKHREVEKRRFTITAALPYANGPLHIGHLAGAYIPADIFARYQRIRGSDVAFICGSDEHGVAIPMRAKKDGVSPKEIIDTYHQMMKDSFEQFGISFDNYSRTSAEIHRETAREFFLKLYEKGIFEEQTSEQLYDPGAGQFLADRYVKGTCPNCKNPEAYGDQCENCGSSLSATDLIDPVSNLSGDKPVLRETRHWYLPLNQYEDFLREWILTGHREDWKPNVYGQCKSWIEQGLKPRAITRDLDWGIPVPLDSADGKVLYVWFDAPIGYISSTREWAEKNGKDWELYWKDADTQLVHFIGKDNIVFHCIIFPIMLKAHGEYILPVQVPANEFLNLEGKKLSTSRNWAVWLHEYLEDFPGLQDSLRYALTVNAPETKDNDFSWSDFQARNNNELVAILGNFVNRVTVLTHKYYDGRVPEPGTLGPTDLQTLEELRAFPVRLEDSLDRYRFREGCQTLMNLARLGNKYLADEEPWKTMKTDPERTRTVLFVALQIAAGLAVLSEPFLPFTSQKLSGILGAGPYIYGKHTDPYIPLEWSSIAEPEALLPHGHTINENALLFRKIEDSEIEAQLLRLNGARNPEPADEDSDLPPQKDTIAFEDFLKLDMRVGTVIAAEKVPKADKLLHLQVDTGIGIRSIVSGIARDFSPEEVMGKRVTVLLNLEPRKLRGVLSEGMILMTEGSDGKLVFVSPEEAGVDNGAGIS